jgi:hypothetical protein
MTSDALRPRVPPSGPFDSSSGGPFVIKVHEGDGIAVDNTDQQNPVVSNLGLLGATAGQGINVAVVDQIVAISTTFAPPLVAVMRLNISADIIVPVAASPNQFVRCTALNTDFTIDQSSGLFTMGTNARITYIADDAKRALILASATTEVAAGNNQSFVSLCIDKNGDTLGQAAGSAPALAAGQMFARAPEGAGSTDMVLSTSRVIALAKNDVLSPTLGVQFTGAPNDIAIEGLTFTVLLF